MQYHQYMTLELPQNVGPARPKTASSVDHTALRVPDFFAGTLCRSIQFGDRLPSSCLHCTSSKLDRLGEVATFVRSYSITSSVVVVNATRQGKCWKHTDVLGNRTSGKATWNHDTGLSQARTGTAKRLHVKGHFYNAINLYGIA